MNNDVAMTRQPKFSGLVRGVALIVLVFFVCGCSRSAFRVSGASHSFAEKRTGETARTACYPYALVVSTPVDQRTQHNGEHVAGTKWTGCTSDPFWGWDAAQMIRQKLVKEFQDSGLFKKVSTAPASPDDVIMKTEILSFCSQSEGSLVIQVVGIISLRVTLEQKGKVLLDRKFERVVTDANIEYTRAEVGYIKKAMFIALTDTLRELLKDLLQQTATESATWTGAARTASPPGCQ
jgi:ABC-type uncharacterized transport system auxiliary subunit